MAKSPSRKSLSVKPPQANVLSVKPPQANARSVKPPQAAANVRSVKPPQANANVRSVKPPQANVRSVKPPQANVRSVKPPQLAEQARTVLPGSEKSAVSDAVHVKATPPRSKITVSVMLKRREELKVNKRGGRASGLVRVSRTEFNKRHAADPSALKKVRAFAKEFKLKVEPDPTAAVRRTVKLTGTAADIQKAFGVVLEQKKINGTEYRVREGGIQLPDSLTGAVEAVLGLDNRPQAQPHFRVRQPHAAAPSSYTPPQVAEAYQFPAKASGAGQTIGIIELGGGYRQADLTAYFKSLGRTAPAITTVKVNGGKNAPTKPSSADGEVMLDIEVAAAVAPGAAIAVYFTPNTDQGFIDAITTAIHDTTNKPSVISISWGGPESTWTHQSMKALDAVCQSAAALGITITVAAGDNGSTDGETGNNVDFPGSSPHVLCCGGTKLDAHGATIVSEEVWNELAGGNGATGGGVSKVFPLPTWQANAKVPAASTKAGGRGVPDVAGDADPTTGYAVRVDGVNTVVGGTSAVAPLWAGLIAVANQQLGKQVGLIQPAIYTTKAAKAFNDITVGDNGGFSAGPGWDACTGLGSPIASKLIPLLALAGAGKAAAKKAAKTVKKTAKKVAKTKPVAKKAAKKKRAAKQRG
ncbi:MAG: protease pro-enzyme activation domain-containing protein [Terracidiphilus sp.]|nr:protease pro-enzyme activation domain-containing protein [Terracidiphilus sp.]